MQCDITTCQGLKNKGCGIEISARLPKYIFLILRVLHGIDAFFYGQGAVTVHSLRGCDAVFECVDESEKMEVLTVTMNFSTIAS